MKQFILIRENGILGLGVARDEGYELSDKGYEFSDGVLTADELLNGDAGNVIEVLSLEELQGRIQLADDQMEDGF